MREELKSRGVQTRQMPRVRKVANRHVRSMTQAIQAETEPIPANVFGFAFNRVFKIHCQVVEPFSHVVPRAREGGVMMALKNKLYLIGGLS
jgi:hypothetical protein